MRHRFFSLRFKVIASISLVLAMTLSLMAWHVTRSEERMLLGSLDDRLQTLGQFVSLISPELLYGFDISSLDRYVDQINTDPDIRFAAIVNTDGELVTTAHPDDVSLQRIREVISGAKLPEHMRLEEFSIVDDGELLGTVVISINQQRMVGLAQQNFYEQLILYFVIIVVLASLIFIIFHVHVLHPIQMLSDGASKVSRGELDVSVPVTTRDELGKLTSCFNEMTEKIRAEQGELHMLNATLISEIEVRKQTEEELHKAKVAAESANKAKSEFLANMSHELRTPLNSIIGFSEMMAYEIKGPLNEAYKEYTGLITRSGRLLLETVNSILDIAKIEAGQLELQRADVSMGDVVNEVIELMDIQAEEKRIALVNDTHDMRHLDVDPVRMKQVFVNIIGNAIKFTDEGSVTIYNHCNDNGHDISIADTGVGMNAEEIEIALKPFRQVHGTSFARRYQGTGLGLSFSKQIMELHGGELLIKSAPGEGTCVTLHFPPDVTIEE